MTNLGEGDVVCDECGRLIPGGRVKGEKIGDRVFHYCPACHEKKEGRRA